MVARQVIGAWVAVLLAGCLPEPSHQSYEETTEAYRVNAYLAELASALQAGRVRELVAKVRPDYLHQGYDVSHLEDWCRHWGETTGSLRVRITEVDIDLPGAEDPREAAADETVIQVSYRLWIGSCSGTESSDAGTPDGDCSVLLDQRFFSESQDGWFAWLKKENGGWIATGDGQSFGVKLTSRHQAASYALEARLWDPQRLIRGARLSGPGVLAGAELSQAPSGEWVLASPVTLATSAASLPRVPVRFELSLTTREGAETREAQLRGFVDEFAAPLEPLGEMAPPFTFRWSPGAGPPRRFQVRVKGETAPLWVSPIVSETQLPYAGPTTEPGKTYSYELWTLDSFGDASVNEGQFTALPPAALTPRPTAVVPAHGSAAGGELVDIEGTSFQSGARVLFGEAEATEVVWIDATKLRCRTPARPAGAANVTVINPPDRVGLLERGFLFE